MLNLKEFLSDVAAEEKVRIQDNIALIEEQTTESQVSLFQREYSVGSTHNGVVDKIKNNIAYITLSGIEAVKCLCFGILKSAPMLKVGDKVTVIAGGHSERNQCIYGTIKTTGVVDKQTNHSVDQIAFEQMLKYYYSRGSRHLGTVDNIQNFGIFARLEDTGLSVLCPKPRNFSLPNIGDKVEVRMSSSDPVKRRLNGNVMKVVKTGYIPAKKNDTYDGTAFRHIAKEFLPNYSLHLGTVDGIANFGIFVKLDTIGFTALCPIPKYRSRMPKPKDKVIVEISSTNVDNGRINGRIKSIDAHCFERHGMPMYVSIRI